jgi:hypothetical protein
VPFNFTVSETKLQGKDGRAGGAAAAPSIFIYLQIFLRTIQALK